MKISFCTTCMGRFHHLKETFAHNVENNKPRKDLDIEFVILNYNSQDGLDEWVKTDPLTVDAIERGLLTYGHFRDAKYFWHAHAKNMAHRLATGDVVCNLDADNFTGPDFAGYLQQKMSGQVHQRFVHSNFGVMQELPDERRGAFGRIVISRENFINLGGYAESFNGWGGEDGNLMVRALAYGLSASSIDEAQYMRTIPHSHEERYRHVDDANKLASMNHIKNAGSLFKGLNLKFREVSGWAQVNSGRFGEGIIYKGLESEPVVLSALPVNHVTYRLAMLGAFPYVRMRGAKRLAEMVVAANPIRHFIYS